MSYLPCELHCHTKHSDGDFTVKSLQNAAANDHLVMIALTDHNTNSGWSEINDLAIPTIRGIEWTTYFGHMLVLGAKENIDWRDATPNNIDEKINEIKNVGGIVGIAHPFQLGSPMCTGGRWEFNVKKMQNVDYMEIWHEDFYPNKEENTKAVELWTKLLDDGYHISCTYGKDWHREVSSDKHYCCTYLDINGEINDHNGKKAIKMGKTVVSTGAKFFFRVHQKMNTYEIGQTIRKGRTVFSFFADYHAREKNIADKEEINYKTIKIITNNNECVLETRFDERHVTLTVKENHWYRAELWGTFNGEKTVLAITSPIYCQ